LISKFADDTNVDGISDSNEDRQRIQQDVGRLETWAERWQMEFNPDKCEVMHFGRSNAGRKYTMNGRTLKSIDRQRDLGVQVHKSLKVATQVVKLVKKAYEMLAFIGRGIEFKNWQVMLQLYRTLVKPPHPSGSVATRIEHYIPNVA